MAQLIRKEDIEAVRSAIRIEDVIGEHITLRSAGAGSLKGLCPFHDERTPSFHVRTQLGLYHCFGCGQGGDVIDFVQKTDHVSFVEAVEYLAGRAGIILQYEEGSGGAIRQEEVGKRHRLVEAHRVAAEYYAAMLLDQEAAPARDFLAERGFDRQAAAQFSIGYAPRSWDSLCRHLRANSFTESELVAAGLASTGNRGNYDRFRGRLMWPIRDLTGACIGFGARRIFADDQGPKYLNTPETIIYKKSQVLYGLDLAKKDIASKRQIVVVEGYTDVMAAHLAGITTAVATCGTAFGNDHVRLVRRLIGDNADPAAGVILSSGQGWGGEIIFTFDGDAAGKKAALRAFNEDQQFASQTFVAIEPNGLDPCDLRLSRGDEAVVALVNSRQPMFAFVIKSQLANVDLDTAEGRVMGLRAAAPVVAQIRDRALRREYVRELAGWLGTSEPAVVQAVKEATSRSRFAGPAPDMAQPYPPAGAEGTDPANVGAFLPSFSDPVVRIEKNAWQAVLQLPAYCLSSGFENLPAQTFTVPLFKGVHDAYRATGGLTRYQELLNHCQQTGQDCNRAGAVWLEEIRSNAGELAQAVTALAVAPLPQDQKERLGEYALGMIASLERLALTRQIGDLRSQLQRTSPQDNEYEAVFALLVETENRRRALNEQ